MLRTSRRVTLAPPLFAPLLLQYVRMTSFGHYDCYDCYDRYDRFDRFDRFDRYSVCGTRVPHAVLTRYSHCMWYCMRYSHSSLYSALHSVPLFVPLLDHTRVLCSSSQLPYSMPEHPALLFGCLANHSSNRLLFVVSSLVLVVVSFPQNFCIWLLNVLPSTFLVYMSVKLS